jgi:tetratricopeptide (TPR) repeat protein
MIANLVSRLLSRGTEVWYLSANAPGSTSPEAVRTFIEARSAFRGARNGRGIELFSRALDIDTTFVQAAYWLTMMAALEDGVSPTLRARASHFAWKYRARLGREQRELLEGVLGPDGPEAAFSRAMAHAALERIARGNNNLPEAWQLLGDSYLHYGALLGYDDWLPRARSAFERVAAIDSTFGNFQHLTTIAYLERNYAEHARRLERMIRLRPDEPQTRFERWAGAIIRGDAADIHDAREQYAQTGGVGGWPWVGGVALPWPQIDSLVIRLDSLARTDAQRRNAKRLTKMVALNAGQPARAGAAARAFYGIDSMGRDLDELIWASDDDSATAARLFKALGKRDTVPNAWLMYCEAMLARLRRGDTTGLGRTLTALRATAAPESREPGQPRLLNATSAAHREARACASLISAIATSLLPGAGVSPLLVADSMMRFKPWHTPTGEMNPHWNYDLALAFARQEKWRLAAAAARRRLFGRGTRLAISLRDEGRWALLANDTAAAMHAFERYLALRPDPEPSVASEVAVVRRQLVLLHSAERTP